MLFTADKPFDYCVAKTTNSRKYELARTLSKPVVTAEWLRDSAAKGELLPLDDPATAQGYRPPAFMGLCVCVTGFTQDERAAIEAKVVANGAVYTSDLVKGRCTHLIASNTTSSKYKHASKWDGVQIVNHRWVDASIASGQRADESKFAVEDELEAAAAAAAAAAAEAEVAMGRDVPWDSCFLLGTRVYLFELEAKGEEARRATRIIRHAGAATTSNPSKATHVVVSDAAQPGSLKPLREHRDRVVFISWLDECERLGHEADVEPHVAPTYMYVGGGGGGLQRAGSGGGLNLSQEAASVDPVVAGKGKQSSRLRTTAADVENDPPPPPPRRRRSSVPAAPNPLTRQALAKEAEAEAAAEAAAASAARAAAGADQNRPPNANAGVGLSLDHGTGTELPATAVAIPETNAGAVPVEGGDEGGGDSLPFDGVRVALSSLLSKEEEDAAREFIAAGGGIAVSAPPPGSWGRTSSAAAYVVCPAAPTAEERRSLAAAPEAERRRHVTCHWLEMCAQQGFVIPLTGEEGANPAYRPLTCDAPVSSMQSLRISTSLYDERVKASVHMICHLLGARYTDRLGRTKNTHLIVPVADGAKYKAAMEWGLRVVTIDWLHACVAAGEKVDEAGFAPQPPASSEPEDDDPEPPPPPPPPMDDDEPNPSGRPSQRPTQDAAPAGRSDRRRSAGAGAGEGSQRPQSQRGALNLTGTAAARASLSTVLAASQPAPPPVAAAAPPPPPSAAPRNPKPKPTPKPKTKPKPTPTPTRRAPARATVPPRRVVGSDETTQPMDEDEASPAAPRARTGTRGDALNSMAAPAVATPARALHDGSQFVANMIDDMAAGMMGAGDATLDGFADDGFDGFRVPDPVQAAAAVAAGGAHDVASPARGGGRGGAGGGSSGVKRRRGGGPTASGVTGGGGMLLSQMDVESQQMVGYADDAPPRGRPSRAVGARGGGSGAGLVHALLGASGEGARGGSNAGGKAGLQAEDWM